MSVIEHIELELHSDSLYRALAACLPVVDSLHNRKQMLDSLMAVKVEVSGDRLTLTSTDRYALVVATVKLMVTGEPVEAQFGLDAAAVKSILSGMPKPSTKGVSADGNRIARIEVEGRRLTLIPLYGGKGAFAGVVADVTGFPSLIADLIPASNVNPVAQLGFSARILAQLGKIASAYGPDAGLVLTPKDHNKIARFEVQGVDPEVFRGAVMPFRIAD